MRSIRCWAEAMKSSKTFCLGVSRPAWCHSSPYSAAAAKISDHVNAALVEPQARPDAGEVGLLVDAVSAVAFDQRGVAAVEPGAFAANDVQGNARAIFRSGKFADDFGVVEVHGRSANQAVRIVSPLAATYRYQPGGTRYETL